MGDSIGSIRGNAARWSSSDGCHIAEAAHQTASASSSLTDAGGSSPSWGSIATSVQSPVRSGSEADTGSATGSIRPPFRT